MLRLGPASHRTLWPLCIARRWTNFSSFLFPGQIRPLHNLQQRPISWFVPSHSKKVTGVWRYLFWTGALLGSLSLFAGESSPSVFSSIQGVEWVKECAQQHPEILWLADKDVRKTEEGQATLQGAYSEQLFGQKYVEFDRTVMTLHCLRLILKGGDEAYETFVKNQPQEVRLSRGSFDQIHAEGQRLLQSKYEGLSELEIAETMETALVLGDLGKSEKARELFKPHGASAEDHDDFYGEAMEALQKHPELCPSFARLSPKARELLGKIAHLAHYGHITHLEGGPGMFTKLKQSGIASTDPLALSLDLFVHRVDVMGALGHNDNVSSRTYTELAHRAIQAMEEAVLTLSDPAKTEWDAYNVSVEARASWLGLSAEDPSERILTRIGAMVRLFDPKEGALLKKGIDALDEETRKRAALQLDPQKGELSDRNPTYVPAVLVNLLSNGELGNSKEERLLQSIRIGIPFLTRVLETHQEMVAEGQIDPNVLLNFNPIAGSAKSSPYSLINGEFTIDSKGMVSLVERDQSER